MNFKRLSVEIPNYVFDEVESFSDCCPESYSFDDAVLVLLITGLVHFLRVDPD